jgi:hypothetical protein
MSASADERPSSPSLLLQGEEELKTFIRILGKEFPKLVEFIRQHEFGCGSRFEISDERDGSVSMSCFMCGNYVRLREVL